MRSCIFTRSHFDGRLYAFAVLFFGALHILYDGFVWKLRRPAVAASLGITLELAGTKPAQEQVGKGIADAAGVLRLLSGEPTGRAEYRVEHRRHHQAGVDVVAELAGRRCHDRSPKPTAWRPRPAGR